MRGEPHEKMGKNTNKPVRGGGKGGGGSSSYGDDGGDGGGGGGDGGPPVKHSAEFEQAELDRLLNPVARPTWDEFKEQQRKKGEMEGAEARAEEEAGRAFRAELDAARNERLGAAAAAAGGDDGKKKHKHKDKHKKDKHKKDKHKKDKHKDKKHKKRRRDSSSEDSDDDSDSDSGAKKKKKKSSKDKADGPVSLRAFFNQGSSDED